MEINIKKLNAESTAQEGYLTLLIKPTVAYIVIDAIMVDICVENKLGEPYTLSDIVFTEFERAGELLRSSSVICQLTKNMFSNIKSVEVIGKEYSVNKKAYKIGQDEYFISDKTEDESIDDLMATVYHMNSTIEVYKYFEELAAKGSILATPELVKMLEKDGWSIDRTKGDHRQFKHPTKKGCVTISGKESDTISQEILSSIQPIENTVVENNTIENTNTLIQIEWIPYKRKEETRTISYSRKLY